MIFCHALLSACLTLTLAPLPTATVQDAPAAAPQTFTGWAFILQADLAAGRRAGTLAADVEDAAARELLATSLRARLVGSGKFVEGHVAVEQDGRISVTFVGKQGEAYDRLLKNGLTNAGRLVCYALADADDVASLPGGLGAQAALFSTWREAHPDLPASAFDALAAEDGGGSPLLVWRPDSKTGAPMALLASTARRVVRFDAGFKFRLMHEDEVPVGFEFTIGEESLASFTEYFAAHTGEELVPVVNGTATPAFVPTAEWDGLVRVTSGLDMEGIRAFLFAFSGEPLCAPLSFVEFAKRPLRNVRTDGIDPEVVPVPAPKPGPK